MSSIAAVDGLDTTKTSLVPATTDPTWNETMKFDIIKKDQYLNVCIWSRSQEKNEKDILLGYVTIPLMDIALRCLLLSSKTHEECFVLVSPHSDRIISNQPYLRNHPGLKERLCCGDVTLIFRHTPSLTDCDESILEKVEALNDSEPENENQEKDTLESLEPPKHQFILTQFYFPTRCSYCNKKVWTKVAFQCRRCAMICHKKCIQNCISYTHCVHASKSTSGWFQRQQSKSGNREKEEEHQEDKDVQGRSSEAVNNVTEASSESEPERLATTSEKVSDEDEKKRIGDGDQIETSDELPSTEGIPDSSEDQLAQRKSEIQANDFVKASERVREAGRELFSNLPLEARKNKLQDMMDRLQVEIDEENETRTELYEERSKAKDRKKKAVVESLLSKSEERSQALAMLMLQYCAGYQSCVEAEELDSYQL